MVPAFVIFGWPHRAVRIQLSAYLLLLFLFATARAQVTSGVAELGSALNSKYSISGTVLNSVTGEPIQRALVQVGDLARLTDSSGAFQFDGLPAGQFGVFARKPGFFTEQEINPSRLPPTMITSGPNAAPVSLKLIPGGVIFGHIVNTDGEGIEELPVHLYSVRLLDGRKRWEQRGGTGTDEQGAFRIGNLPPGTYYLAAGPRTLDLISARQSTPPRGYSHTFYPAGNDLASASPLVVAPGQKMQADMLLKLEPFYEVSGVVTGYDPNAGINIFFSTGSGEHLRAPTRIDSATGQFQTSVPRGTYKLHASAQDLSATMPLSVHSDIAGIQLALQPVRFIPIIVQNPASKAQVLRAARGVEFPTANVRLLSSEDSLQPIEYSVGFIGDEKHRLFGLQGVEPGKYRVEVTPNFPGYVQSARCGDVDLLQEDLHVSSAPTEPIEVVIRDDGATLTGTVTGVEANVPAGLLLLPDHGSLRRLQTSFTDVDGKFQLGGLPPGDYSVLAFDRLESLEYRNPDFLSSYLSRAAHVMLSPNAESKLTVNLIRVEK